MATRTTVEKELNLDEKVTVKNIANWSVGFSRRTDGNGDVIVAPNGQVRLTRNEIIAQVQSNNPLFSGIDGIGSHATLFIDDAATRKELDFDDPETQRKQLVFTESLVRDVFSIKSQQAFEQSFSETFITRAEKYAVIQAIKKLQINDYLKIRFAEKSTGYSIEYTEN